MAKNKGAKNKGNMNAESGVMGNATNTAEASSGSNQAEGRKNGKGANSAKNCK